MNLKILLPSEIFLQKDNLLRVIVETQSGSYGFLPKRLDCVAAITPGLLIYENKEEGIVFLALDEGIMIKKEKDIIISTRQAIREDNLKKLRKTIQKEFLTKGEKEKDIRWMLKKMENNLITNLSDILS